MGSSETAVALPAGGLSLDLGNLRILLVDSKASSRQSLSNLISECGFQVSAVRTAKEAIDLLEEDASVVARHGSHGAAGQASGGAEEPGPVSLIIKDHEPPDVDATRLLRRLAQSASLQSIPVVVMSAQDDREMVMKCLQSGAIDYLIKPLRRNELQNIWTRVYWRQVMLRLQTTALQTTQQQLSALIAPLSSAGGPHGSRPLSPGPTTESRETQCIDDQEPASKEGSAPVDTGSGRNGGSKEGNNGSGTLDVKTGHGSNNGNSGDNNGINSGSKNGHNRGSNGNGCSTSRMAVAGSGNQPPLEHHHHHHHHHHHDPTLASEAGHTNGNGHGSNGHGGANGNGSGDNGNGSGNGGGTGQSTVQSQQTGAQGAGGGRAAGCKRGVREFDVPSSRGPMDYASAAGGSQPGGGFRQWAPTNGVKSPQLQQQLAGTKRPHPEGVGQLGFASGSGRARHSSRPPHSSEPTDAPQSNPYEGSGTGGQGSTKPSLPTPQSHLGGAAGPLAGVNGAYESFGTRSEGTGVLAPPSASAPLAASSPAAAAAAQQQQQHHQQHQQQQDAEPLSGPSAAGGQVYWGLGRPGPSAGNGSHRLKSSAPKPSEQPPKGGGLSARHMYQQPPPMMSQQPGSEQGSVQQGSVQPGPGFGPPPPAPFLMYPGGQPFPMPPLGGWPGQAWSQGHFPGGQPTTALEAQQQMLRMFQGQGGHGPGPFANSSGDGGPAAAAAAMQQQQAAAMQQQQAVAMQQQQQQQAAAMQQQGVAMQQQQAAAMQQQQQQAAAMQQQGVAMQQQQAAAMQQQGVAMQQQQQQAAAMQQQAAAAQQQQGGFPYGPYFMHLAAANMANMNGMSGPFWRPPWPPAAYGGAPGSDSVPRGSNISSHPIDLGGAAGAGATTPATAAPGKSRGGSSRSGGPTSRLDDGGMSGGAGGVGDRLPGVSGSGGAVLSSGHHRALDGGLYVEPTREERRAQALGRFKEKKKAGNITYTKKIRYEMRKQLADARPRHRGQFVRTKPSSDGDKDTMTTNGASMLLPSSSDHVLTSCGGASKGGGAVGATRGGGSKRSAEERAAVEALQAIHSMGGIGGAAMDMDEAPDGAAYGAGGTYGVAGADAELQHDAQGAEPLHPSIARDAGANVGLHCHHLPASVLLPPGAPPAAQAVMAAARFGQPLPRPPSLRQHHINAGVGVAGDPSGMDLGIPPLAGHPRSGQGSGGVPGRHAGVASSSFGVDSNAANRSNGEASNGGNGRGRNSSDSGSNSPERNP